MTEKRPNHEQQKALETLLSFCDPWDPRKEIVLTGGPGTGKTFVLECLQELSSANIAMTATTNKAANVLNNGCTIDSLIGLTLKDDPNSLKEIPDPQNLKTPDVSVIVIDESSMLDRKKYRYIQEAAQGIKIIYVGDQYQLRPVGDSKFSVFDLGLETLELTEVMRTGAEDLKARQKAIKYNIWRKNRFPKTFNLEPSPNMVVITDPYELKDRLCESFEGFDFYNNQTKWVSYTNDSSIKASILLRKLLKEHQFFDTGDVVCCRSAAYGVSSFDITPKKDLRAKLDSLLSLDRREDSPKGDVWVSDETNLGYIFPSEIGKVHKETKRLEKAYEKIRNQAKDPRYLTSPFYKNEVDQRIKDARKNALSYRHTFLDARDPRTCTVHGSQGSTYKEVFVDWRDLCSLKKHRNEQSYDQFWRLSYVACSRASKRVNIVDCDWKKL